MTKKLLLVLSLSIATALPSLSQSIDKKPLTHAEYDSWKDLAKPAVSANGEWVTWEVNPQKGDGFLHLQNLQTGKHDSLPLGSEAIFSSTSDLLVFKIKQPENVLRKHKVSKTKKEDMPKDSLGIWLLAADSTVTIRGLKSFQLPKEGGAWIAYLQDTTKEKAKSKGEVSDTLKPIPVKDTSLVKSKPEPKGKDKKAKKGAFNEVETNLLVIVNPLTRTKYQFEDVTEAAFSKNGALCAFVTLKKDSTDSTSVQIFDTRNLQVKKVFENKGLAKKIVPDDAGRQVAWLHTADTAKVKRYSLNLWEERQTASGVVADSASSGLPKNWEVSENGRINFSADG
ncbi:MAG TPA: hypothetical protein VN249_05290, partial [Prolixibacteraceae bacterium]|nr:hypothetical protein [Prolixibacteraceae bacterium]